MLAFWTECGMGGLQAPTHQDADLPGYAPEVESEDDVSSDPADIPAPTTSSGGGENGGGDYFIN